MVTPHQEITWNWMPIQRNPKKSPGILEVRFRQAFVKLCDGRLWHAQLRTGVPSPRNPKKSIEDPLEADANPQKSKEIHKKSTEIHRKSKKIHRLGKKYNMKAQRHEWELQGIISNPVEIYQNP